MEIKAFKGLNNTTSPERFKPGELAVALDVEIDNTGKIMSRRGKTLVHAGAKHSLYAYAGGMFVSSGATIYAVENDGSLTATRTLSTADRVAYDENDGVVYYSNGTDTGRIVGRTPLQWGVTPPVSQPTASAQPIGNLPAGRYLFAMTFVRSDGHESGTGLSGQIDLLSPGGIRFDNLEVSTNPEVSDKMVYLTSVDGETLYRADVVPNGQTSTYVTDEPLSGVPLATQFAGPPPPGEIVRIFNGVAYVVSNNVVYYSDPYNLELFRLDTQYLQFPDRIALFDWVNSGIYAATFDSEGDGSENPGTTWFLAGSRPDQFAPKQVFEYGATLGTSVRVESGYFGQQVERIGSPSLIWTTRHGVCVGDDGGNVNNLTESRFSFPAAQRGAAAVIQDRGFVKYVVVSQGTGDLNNAYE